MLYFADVFVALLTPFLVLSALALAGMLVFLIGQRGVDELQFRFRQRTAAHYRDTPWQPDRWWSNCGGPPGCWVSLTGGRRG